MRKKERERGAVRPAPDQAAWVRLAEKEIFENITQCLCLARIQMSSVRTEDPEQARRLIGEASLLIGKAVQDLRILVKQFKNATLTINEQDHHRAG